jgi:hypothetical protein
MYKEQKKRKAAHLEKAAFHHDLLSFRGDASQIEELTFEDIGGLSRVYLDVGERFLLPFDANCRLPFPVGFVKPVAQQTV